MSQSTYLNPVYPRSCPDPFVLKFRGEYWAYCTGIWQDGRSFGILHSTDLIHWRALAGALEPFSNLPPLEIPPNCYWAPEVTYDNGLFYLYYSVGNEEHMQIRVAVAEQPGGPFTDRGHRLTQEEFAIDAHVYQGEDGARYLFYATDFLEHTHIGTGAVMDRLVDPFTLAGEPRPVARASFDWQVYHPQRIEKGGVRWHTVEGPFVLNRKGRFYLMFSGGNWQNPGYGVAYALSDNLETSEEWQQVCDGLHRLPVLRSLPEQGIIGPGHNSVVRGPDNRQLFCVYHRWVESDGAEGQPDRQPAAEVEPCHPAQTKLSRAMAIDRLEWIGERMAVLGPSAGPQPAPNRPTLAYFGSGFGSGHGNGQPPPASGLGPDWTSLDGEWSVQDGAAVQSLPFSGRMSEARLHLPAPSFLLEAGLKALPAVQRSPGAYGLLLDNDNGEVISLVLVPRTGRGTATGVVVTGFGEQRRDFHLNLPQDFAIHAIHQVRLEVNGLHASLGIDGLTHWWGRLDSAPTRAVLFTRGMAAAYSAFELTLGWEDLFNQPGAGLHSLGWQANPAVDDWQIQDQQLWHTNLSAEQAAITRPVPIQSGDYELVVNVRMDQAADPLGGYGFYPAMLNPGSGARSGPMIRLQPSNRGWALAAVSAGGEQIFALPEDFDPHLYQQFRFLKQNDHLLLQVEASPLGEIQAPPEAGQIGIFAERAIIALDMVRLTALSGN